MLSVASAPHAYVLSAPSLLPPSEGNDFHTSLTRARLEDLCQDLFRSTRKPVKRVLRDSKIDKSQVHGIVLVGGSTRIPHIVKFVSDFFNDFFNEKEPNETTNADEAGETSERTSEILLLDVAPRSLSIETSHQA